MVCKKIIFILFAAQLALPQNSVTTAGDVSGAVKQEDSKQVIEDKKIIKNKTDTTIERRTSRQLRFDKSVTIGVSWDMISMWLPSKLGASLSYNFSERKTLTAEYQSQSIKFPAFSLDIGGIRESKYGVILKSFGDSQSFYMSYGLMKYDFRASLDLSLFPASVPIAPLFDFGSLGFQFGLGNQFTWENGLSLGIDWFSIYFHSFNKTKNTEIFGYLNASDRDKADKTIDLIYNIPIIEILKIQLCYGF
jgi:hypothetical protein